MAGRAYNALTVLGGIAATLAGFRFVDFIWFYFLRPSSLTRYKHGSENKKHNAQPWALITGSSDGIGRGFAEELCLRGFNIILHGRSSEKLTRVRTELLKQWPNVQIRIAVLDGFHFTKDGMDAMVRELEGLNITILINNVGGVIPGKAIFRPLQDLPQEDIDGFTSLNDRFPTILTAKLLPQLIQNGPALIINMGSFAGTLPIAYHTVYGGSKGFTHSWGQSLHYEMIAEAHDVEILTLKVGEVQNSWDRSPAHFFRPNERAFARSALHKVGSGRGLVTPYPTHALLAGFLLALPEVAKKQIFVGMARDMQQREVKMSGKQK